MRPQSLQQALAFLDRRPRVRLTTRNGNGLRHVHSRFIGRESGALWFQSCATNAELIGLRIGGSADEVGFTFDEGGFHYHKGPDWVRVAYGPGSQES
jgi:hypothetical protein